MEEVIGDMMASKEKVGQLSHKLEVLDHDFTGLLAQLDTVLSIIRNILLCNCTLGKYSSNNVW